MYADTHTLSETALESMTMTTTTLRVSFEPDSRRVRQSAQMTTRYYIV